MLRASRPAGRAPAGALVLAALALAAGCSSGAEKVPPACFDDSGTFLRALRAAPHPVALEGTRISSCFARRSATADIESVGGTLIAAAERLGQVARAAPSSPAATELGYLIGASERGAARTEGIHYELLRRLQMELIGVDTRAPAYRAGWSAGHRFG